MNILVTGAWNCTRQQLKQLTESGHQVVFLQQETDALPVAYDWVEGVICNGLFLHHPIERFEKLRYIQLTSAGFDRISLEYIQEKGITLHNARDVYSIPMAEFAVSGVLQLYKQSRFFDRNREGRMWQKHRGLLELFGKEVCIIGCGSVGTECAKRFRAFGCRVVGIDLYPEGHAPFEQIFPLGNLNDQLATADVVILTLPLTEKSRSLLNSQRLSLMKKGAVLVNVARGALVETKALTRWLQERQGAAVLDVFDEEPLPEHSPFWELDNVILTPHNSFVGEGNAQRLYDIILQNLQSI